MDQGVKMRATLKTCQYLLSLTVFVHLSGCGVAAVTKYSSDNEIKIDQYPTKAIVLARMGRPHTISCTQNDEESWTYRSDIRWKGVFLWAIIVPIPLMAPIGRDSRTFTFQGPHTTAIKSDEVKTCFTSAFLAPSTPIGGSGASSECHFYEFKTSSIMETKEPETACTKSTQH
jgi:hypothetical protein